MVHPSNFSKKSHCVYVNVKYCRFSHFDENPQAAKLALYKIQIMDFAPLGACNKSADMTRKAA